MLERESDLYDLYDSESESDLSDLQWVIQTAQAEAEAVIDAAKAKEYHDATHWLKYARDAYFVAGREREWQSYVHRLRQEHGRKYKLMGLLREL